MKKILAVCTALIVLICTAGIGTFAETQEKYSIVCTTFPQYDWICAILGERAENFEMTLLLDNGVDLHNYQPAAADIVKISTGDLFVYVGGESDAWVDQVLDAAPNADLKVISLLESVEAMQEESVEGMQAEDHDHDDDEVEYDEHVWLSLRNAQVICQVLADALCELDGENAAVYQQNAQSYIAELAQLDGEYQLAVESGAQDTLLFADRFPFRYLAEDYGLNYYAAFSGCAAETEASFETIAFLARKVDELGLNAVLTLEGADHAIAETVVASTQAKNQQILQMDSMQSITAADVEGGANYLEIMTRNLEALELALN